MIGLRRRQRRVVGHLVAVLDLAGARVEGAGHLDRQRPTDIAVADGRVGADHWQRIENVAQLGGGLLSIGIPAGSGKEPERFGRGAGADEQLGFGHRLPGQVSRILDFPGKRWRDQQRGVRVTVDASRLAQFQAGILLGFHAIHPAQADPGRNTASGPAEHLAVDRQAPRGAGLIVQFGPVDEVAELVDQQARGSPPLGQGGIDRLAIRRQREAAQ